MKLQRGLGIAAEDRFSIIHDEFGIKALQRGLGIAAEDRSLFVYKCPLAYSFNGASASLPRIGSRRP